ncbi:MAG: amidophosphoribosyltransferase [Oscillospiraceae bacterium]|nr:amidophosphoribosyltransferase [Oscillospiraceae bacterium]
MSIHEECGVYGIYSTVPRDLAETVYYGLYALQHRGQESCGIAVCDDGVITAHRDTGLVGDVFTPDVLSQMPRGNIAAGHVRYSTTGGNERRNAQPIVVNHSKGRMAIAHNGNLSNAQKLRRELEMSGAIFHTTSDTEIIAYIITRKRLTTASIEDAVSAAMDTIEGAYSLVIVSPTKLIAARDPHGFRPLCYGELPDGSYVVSSESCGITSAGGKFIRDIAPGEILVFNKDGIETRTEHCQKAPKKICIFEYIYFARPDSYIDGVSVHSSRIKAGEILAECCPADADIVIGVPDSGLDAALGFSRRSGIPYGIGLIKNKYIGRTFISPTQASRADKVMIKLSPLHETVQGKRIVLVDDSIVRGTTSKRIVALLRDAGAKEIHFRVSSPPFVEPCFYGTDIGSRDELIAVHHTEKETAAIIGADSLGYLPVNRLCELIGSERLCNACFTGDYPTETPENSISIKDKFDMKIHTID